MKKIFMFMLLVGGALSLGSCLNYDEPGDELEMDKKLYQYENPKDTTTTNPSASASVPE
ncbi:MAG: hypothetical protein HUK00_06150 [Bacteroidaceae bacterium]|nr:hypothetical protein [Bacteroidaceae bacterium]